MIYPAATSDLTPLMKQYFAIKQQYPHALLLFQVGDFYELFFDDAKSAAAFLGIALTKRGKVNGDPIPLCGVPVHALDHYLAKLIKGGFKVAICDQLEEPKPGKVVERGVTRVLTPGTLTDSKLLDEKSASYLFSFFPAQNQWGLLFAELLTAQLFATVLPADSQKSLESELIRFFPDEIIIPNQKQSKIFEPFFKQRGYCTAFVDQTHLDSANAWIQKQLLLNNDCADSAAIQQALSYFYTYILQTQQSALDQFKSLTFYEPDDFLILDQATQTNLELVSNAIQSTKRNTLFQVLDGALTPMGSRMIKKWIMRPLVKQTAIIGRQDVIEQFHMHIVCMQQLEKILIQCGDIERVIGRIALGRAPINDFIHLKNVLALIPEIMSVVNTMHQTPLLAAIKGNIADFQSLHQLLDGALNSDADQNCIIKAGFDFELDALRDNALNATQKILHMELQEQQTTGINSLKIRYNQIHGYYIEITKTHSDAIPPHYIRQQTLVGRERYITPQLQQLQHEILYAQTQMSIVEKNVFEKIKTQVIHAISSLRKLAHSISNLDALLGLARIAYQNGYCRPTFNEYRQTYIADGFHPVVQMVIGNRFIPNNTCLDDTQSTHIITGPNMGGKSTYLRQVALIHIMAQIGSYVPAQEANLTILDRIFTRIGAGDNVSEGKSTFLIEMEETAAICTMATSKSLVILDEVGRGTSTFDGLSIAQAVVEYIHSKIKARCLFATHYHELTQLPSEHSGITCYHAQSIPTENGIQFLYKIVPGVAQGSFGLEVAKLAHIPNPIIVRAGAILQELQQTHHHDCTRADQPQKNNEQETIAYLQAALHQKEKQLMALSHIDYDNLSPKAAFDLLWKFKQLG